MKINKYPDGSSYVEVRDNSEDEYNNYTTEEFTFRINSYEDLWHLNQTIDAYNNHNIYPIVTIPNLIDAQADRRFNSNQSSGLKLVCHFLNNMNANFRIFHPHNQEVVEALMDNVEIIDNTKFIRDIIFEHHNGVSGLNDYDNDEVQNNLILMSSDAGGFKPLIKLCDKIQWQGEVFSASKARGREMGETTLIQQVNREDFKGKDILIIDDISVYGGTFKNLSKILREKNVGKLYLAVSHMTVQNLGEDNVLNYFDKVFTTNSKYDYYYYYQTHNQKYKDIKIKPNNLEIISLFN